MENTSIAQLAITKTGTIDSLLAENDIVDEIPISDFYKVLSTFFQRDQETLIEALNINDSKFYGSQPNGITVKYTQNESPEKFRLQYFTKNGSEHVYFKISSKAFIELHERKFKNKNKIEYIVNFCSFDDKNKINKITVIKYSGNMSEKPNLCRDALNYIVSNYNRIQPQN